MRVATSPNYVINSFAFSRRSIQRQLCGRTTTSQIDFITSRWQRQTIKRRMLSPNLGLRYSYSRRTLFLAINSTFFFFSFEDELSTSFCSTVTADDIPRPQDPISEATSWRKCAGFYDSRVQASKDIGRPVCAQSPECFTSPPVLVSVSTSLRSHGLDGISFQWR
jgi:hypothetical protein